MEKTEKKIAVACDHAGNGMKDALIAYLREKGYLVKDYGCDGTASVDYPEYAHLVCRAIQENEADCGILICGTGIGMSMAANKHRGIRAALCENEFSAEMTRRHNDANVLCLGARVLEIDKAKVLTDLFLTTAYEGGRHDARLALLRKLDEER